jgi:hypothetical protein
MCVFLITQLDTREENEKDKRAEDEHKSWGTPDQVSSEVSAHAVEGDAEMLEFKNMALRDFLVMYHEQYVTESSAASHTKVSVYPSPNIIVAFTP